MIIYRLLLLLTGLLSLATAQADTLARQQDLSRQLQEQQLDLKLQQNQQLPPAFRPQTHTQQQRLQRQKTAQQNLYEQQRRELLHDPVSNEQRLQREREAQTLDFKLNNNR